MTTPDRVKPFPKTYLKQLAVININGVRFFQDSLTHHGITEDPSLDGFHRKMRTQNPKDLALWLQNTKDTLGVVLGLLRTHELDKLAGVVGPLTLGEEQALVTHGFGERTNDIVFEESFSQQEIDGLIERGIAYQESLRRPKRKS